MIALLTACEPEPFDPGVESSAPSQAETAQARMARVLEPLELDMTNPAGIAFSPISGTFFVVTHQWGALTSSVTDVGLVTLGGDSAGTVQIAIELADPINVAFDAHAGRLLILEPLRHQLTEIRANPDGTLDPETSRQLDVQNLGLRDPQGMTVDPASGRVFILDSGEAGQRIVILEPDIRGDPAWLTVAAVPLVGLSNVRGLAFDPTTGHLFVLNPNTTALYELTQAGQLVATRDLSAFGFHQPQGMTFGPSGDTTDHPSELSLYIADRGIGSGASPRARGFRETGHITEISLVQPAGTLTPSFAISMAAMEVASLVQTIQTSQFSPPSPDPAGITYLGHLGDLLISDSEVNEMSIFTGVNQFRITLSGSLVDTFTTTLYSNEPTGVSWNPANLHLFYSDDSRDEIFEVNPGPDGLYDTPDDIVTSFDTRAFNSNDPEGVTYDFAQGVLFIVDGVNAEVYRVSPGSNGVFDGLPPAGDDQVTSFDTEGFGLTDPEGIAHDSDFGHLYIVGKPDNLVFHVTTDGTLLRTLEIGAANPDKPAGLAYAPSSTTPGTMSLWIVDRGTDNNSDPNENDGLVYEFSLPSFGGNALPTVTITSPATGSTYSDDEVITFTGTASDAEDGDLTGSLGWTSDLDGSIGSGGSFATSTLSVGTHTITASVTDAGGSTASDAITVTVNVEGMMTVEVRVATSSDDAEESASGSVSLTSSDLEMVYDRSDQTVGLRFTGVPIPLGATISSASIQFQVDEANATTTSLTIQGQAADNPPTFSSSSGNISGRARTANAVSWSPQPWTTVGAAGPDQQTPNIAAVVQEIVNRSGWASGNALVIIITGTGERVAESFNGAAAAAALLQVEFYTGPPPEPTVNADNSSVTTNVSSVPANGASSATITVTLRNDANDPVSGHAVSLGQGGGNSTIGAASGPSDANGRVTFSVTSTTAETVTYTATDVTDGVVIVQTAQVTFEPLPTDADASTVTATPSVVPPDGASSATIAVTLANSLGVPMIGHTVSLAQGSGSSTISAASGSSDANGRVTFTVTNTTAETVTYTATDVTEGVVITQTAQVTFDDAPSTSIIEVRVAASTDDAEERDNGRMYLNSSDLELVYDRGDQTVGMRFTGVTIPRGAAIVDAYVQFQVDETPSGTTSLTVAGEAADNAVTFGSSDRDISSRDRTTVSVPWTPEAWSSVGDAGLAQRTPNLAGVIQEIVGRSSWVSGNALVIIITGTGERVAEAFDGVAAAAPLLHVEYSN